MEPTRPSLLIRIKDRDDATAWTEFFDLYSPMLYSYARVRGLSHDDAEDIRSSCYETIVQKIRDFEYEKEKGGFRAWLRTMVNHRVIDMFRKRKMPIAQSSDLGQLESDQESVDELFDQYWRIHHLRHCVQLVQKRVKPETFQVFQMLTEEGASVEQICEQMEMNSDQVYKIKSRVLALVRDEMQQFDLEA